MFVATFLCWLSGNDVFWERLVFQNINGGSDSSLNNKYVKASTDLNYLNSLIQDYKFYHLLSENNDEAATTRLEIFIQAIMCGFFLVEMIDRTRFHQQNLSLPANMT